MRLRQLLVALPAGFLIATASLVAACGGDDGAPALATASDDEGRRKFAQCLREHGVDVPDPESGEGLRLGQFNSIDRGKLTEALQACQDLVPDGGDRTKFSAEQLEQTRAFAQCMREHGINLPDPDPETGPAQLLAGGSIDFASEEFRQAYEACQDLRPKLRSGGTR